jgi:hypothetical protein
MKQVLKVSDLIQNEEKKESKGIELTHYKYFNTAGDWQKCSSDGELQRIKENNVFFAHQRLDPEMELDLFIAHFKSFTVVYKGHLNDGTY